MSSTIIFKQSYKPRTLDGAAGLNVRHLNYIATRPGAVYNKGCGFSLWGQLPGQYGVHIQTDLEAAKRTVREASANHTLFRAILSVGKEDAQQHGLYDRTKWEELINDHVSVIAKQMEIKPQDFCWCAAMHYSKGHPHVHLIYWDASTDPRNDYIPEKIFTARAEKIRAEFAGAIHREEIRELQQEQREQIGDLRTHIRAMFREANPERGINLSRLISDPALEPIAQQLRELVLKMPAKGSLRYAYLPPDYKLLVDQLIDRCLEIPELKQELDRYILLTCDISRLYANGEDGTADAVNKATGKLKKELANELMKTIRDLHTELLANLPAQPTPRDEIIREAVQTIAAELPSYDALKAALPAERIPVGKMAEQIPGYRELRNTVMDDLLADARVRIPLQQYALAEAGIHLSEKPPAPRRSFQKNRPAQRPPEALTEDAPSNHPSTELAPEQAAGGFPEKSPVVPSSTEDNKRYSLFGKEVSAQEWTDYQESYRESVWELRRQLTDQLREDAGWNREAAVTNTGAIVCSFARILSQAANQQQAAAVQARNNLKTRSKDKSREAKKDYRVTQTFASEWDDGYN